MQLAINYSVKPFPSLVESFFAYDSAFNPKSVPIALQTFFHLALGTRPERMMQLFDLLSRLLLILYQMLQKS